MEIDNIVLNITYVLYVIAPLIRDELKLRVLLAVASVGFAVWATMIDSPWTVFWNVIFIGVSLYNIVRILRERRPLELGDEQENIRRRLFPEMTTRQFARFWALGDDHHAVGEQLTLLGTRVTHFWIFLDGDLRVELTDGQKAMEPGATVGGMSYVMGDDVPATASVVAHDAQLRRWPKATLRALAHTDAELNAPFLSGIGRGLVSKIRT